MSVNIHSFRQRVRHRKTRYKRFLSRLEGNPPARLDTIAASMENEIWKEVNCISCANCCKTMSPTFTRKDIRTIASFLGITQEVFRSKWLIKDREGDWVNRSTPCQFLDPDTNHCGIYDVRPADCKGFPHLSRKKMVDYMHVHRQNVESCPATFKMVERMILLLHKKK